MQPEKDGTPAQQLVLRGPRVIAESEEMAGVAIVGRAVEHAGEGGRVVPQQDFHVDLGLVVRPHGLHLTSA